MTFGRAISSGFRQYVSGNGRATRAEFWWLYLFAVLVTSPANIYYQVSVSSNQASGTPAELVGGLFGSSYWMLSAVALVVGIPLIAAAVRRLHDTGRSGYRLLLGLIPVAGPIILLVFLLEATHPGPNVYDN